MLKWQADFLLATNAILECTDLICLNYGTCLNFGVFTSNNAMSEICFCVDGFFGPNCGYTDDDLATGDFSSHEVLSISDDDNLNHSSGYSVDGENFEYQPEYETQHETRQVIEHEVVYRLEEMNVPAPKFRADRRHSHRKKRMH